MFHRKKMVGLTSSLKTTLPYFNNWEKIMNICVVSTFDGTTNDWMEMFNAAKEKAADFFTDYDIGIIREGKISLMIHITDMEKFQELMASEEMQAWDAKFNCVDEVYSLEKIN
tara:strand:- start:1761 stop:2099 length:339 start_codon:yes stop_codon:yes gene_type:complete